MSYKNARGCMNPDDEPVEPDEVTIGNSRGSVTTSTSGDRGISRYDQAAIVCELLLQAQNALGAAFLAAKSIENAPDGCEGLYKLAAQVGNAWWKFMCSEPDEDGDTIESLVGEDNK